MDLLKKIIDALAGDPASVGIIVGIVTPLLVALIQRPTMSKQLRTVIAIAAAVIIGLISAAASGQLSQPSSALTLIVVLYATCEAAYQKIWKATGLAKSIEVKTSPTPVIPAQEPAGEEDPISFE